jgi:RHS repeat-associated protein
VKSAYNVIGQLCGVGASVTWCTVTTPYASNFTYNAPGQVTGFTYGNGVTASTGYSNNRLQMTSLAYAKGSTTLLSLNYLYAHDSTYCASGATGNNGQIQCVNDVTDSPGTGRTGRSAAYTYDELGRLASALTTGTSGTGGYPQWGLSFTYDRFGNLIKEQSTAGSVGTTCLSVSAFTNQVTGSCAVNPLSTYNYDANGNMLKDGANILTYDAENRTTNATIGSSSVADYVYDGNGLRVKKCTPSCSASSPTITVYIFSGSKVIAEYTVSSGTPTLAREYLYAGGLKVATVDTATTYHLRDHLSVRVNTNSSGAIIGEQGHYPFGDIWYPLNTTTKEMFTTYERDPETGTGATGTGNDYAMARYNVTRLGRFSSIDPVGATADNPQTLNRYAYVTNDPINLADPTGQDAVSLGPDFPAHTCSFDAGVGYGVSACGDMCEVRVSSNCDETGGGAGGIHVNFSFDFPGQDDPFGESNGIPYGVVPAPFSLFNLLFGGNQQCEFGGLCGNSFQDGAGGDGGPDTFANCVKTLANAGSVANALGLGNSKVGNLLLGSTTGSFIELGQDLSQANALRSAKDAAGIVAGQAIPALVSSGVRSATTVTTRIVAVRATESTLTVTALTVTSRSLLGRLATKAISVVGLATLGVDAIITYKAISACREDRGGFH